METSIQLSKDQKPFPRLGLGTWKIANEKTADVVYEALKIGFRFIDCAYVYGNEKEVGEGIQRAIKEKIVTREELWITSKLWCTDHSMNHVEKACKLSLKLLQLDYLDLYLIHFPLPLKHVPFEKKYPPGFFNASDPQVLELERVPLSETWKAMEELVDKKLVRNIGVSNFHIQLLQDLLMYCRIKPFNLQVEMHPFLQQEILTTFCEKNNITVTGYSSFGARSYKDMDAVDTNEVELLKHPLILKIAEKHKKSPAQILLKWAIQKYPLCNVIPKASCVAHLKDNFDLFSFKIDEESMKAINDLECNKRYNNPNAMLVNEKSYYPTNS